MPQTTTKVGHVTFNHADDYRGEVEIERAGARLSVPILALRQLIAESLRAEMIDQIQRMKPVDLLKPERLSARLA